jgi:hypothetical protein
LISCQVARILNLSLIPTGAFCRYIHGEKKKA